MRLRKAFTLIELLIVVAIIAILAAIAVPNFLEAQVRSKVSRNKTDMRSIATALEAYAVDNNKYPAPWDQSLPGKGPWPIYTEPPAGPFHARTPDYITTPIAYMTSLPDDPFRTSDDGTIAANLKPWAKRHIYFNIDYFFLTPAFAPPAINNFTQVSPIAGKWLMYSVGPDKDEFNTPAGQAVVSQRVYRDYDPTNGTVSLGNVFRTQASGDRLGTINYFYTTP